MKKRKSILMPAGRTGGLGWNFEEKLITKEEAAELLGVSHSTICNWLKNGKNNFSVVYLSKYVVRLKISEVIEAMHLTEEEKQYRREILMKRITNYVSIQTAAGVLGISPGLLYDVENGKKTGVEQIPFEVVNGHKRIKKSDLYEYIDRHTVK